MNDLETKVNTLELQMEKATNALIKTTELVTGHEAMIKYLTVKLDKAATNKETVIDDYKELFDIIRSRKMEWEMESDGAYTKITFKTSLCCTLSDY